MKTWIDLFLDDTVTKKAILFLTSGVVFGSVGLETVDLWLGIILKICGLIAFAVTVFIQMPRIIELLQLVLKAIDTTFGKKSK